MKVTNSHLYGALSRVEQFTGRQDVRSWLEKFELGCDIDGVKSTNEKASMLKVLLVNEIFRAVNEQGFGTDADYDTIKKYLIDNFGECESAYLTHNRFIVAYQEPAENCRVYGLRLRALARKAFPSAETASLDQHLCNQFIRGCYDRDVKRHLFLSKLTKFDELVNSASLIECTIKDEKGDPGRSSYRPPENVNTRFQNMSQSIPDTSNQFNNLNNAHPQIDHSNTLNEIQLMLRNIQNRLDKLETKSCDSDDQISTDDKKRVGKAQHPKKGKN